MAKAVKMAESFLDEEELSIKEWQMITSTLATAYSALYNKAGTVVNVAQTNVNAEKESLKFFQAAKRDI